MKKYLLGCQNVSTSSNGASAALLVVRLVAGLAFAIHGFGKIQHPFAWMGPDAPVPGILQALAAVAEFGGGILWIFGLLTPGACILILPTMTVAMTFHLQKGDGFVGGYELAAVYWTIALLLLLVGPGKFSVDAKIKNCC